MALIDATDLHTQSVLALDLRDLLEDWAVRRGFGADAPGLSLAVEVGMAAARRGEDLGDAFERAKNAFIRF